MVDEHIEPAKISKRWVWLVAVPVLYVLSIGPVILIATLIFNHVSEEHAEKWGGAFERVYSVVYAPLLLVCKTFPRFSRLLSQYIDLITWN